MKGFIAFMLCMMFLMFTSVEQGYTAQSKAEVGISMGVPAIAAIAIDVPATATITDQALEYSSIGLQPFDHGLSVAILAPNKSIDFSLFAIDCNDNRYLILCNYAENNAINNRLQSLHIDPGSQSCAIESSNPTQLVTVLHIDPGNYSIA